MGDTTIEIESASARKRSVHLVVLVAALGYFVDVYDLNLFNVVRLESLRSLGFTGEAALTQGLFLLNMQMGGMLVGGLAWGMLGDKRGRRSILFGSILLYSLANIANGFVTDIQLYGVLRAIAGIGLAGELGAGITLVSESMDRESRGYGTTLVVTMGILGAVAVALVGNFFPWRVAYFIGGGLGLSVLFLRIGVHESRMFVRVTQERVERGNFLRLFATRSRASRYVSVILIGVPTWFNIAILVVLSPELGKAMGMAEPPKVGPVLMIYHVGLALGTFGSGVLSQYLRTRKRVISGFLILMTILIASYFLLAHRHLIVFYAICVALGTSAGYWSVLMTTASEQFGTNLRATATTSIPNFVRGAVVPLTLSLQFLKPMIGVVESAAVIGAITLGLAFLGLRGIEETYGKDLDFIER
jgi:MFS transporter, putative metabolite:H+ symporter